jgi:hypothetical protein
MELFRDQNKDLKVLFIMLKDRNSKVTIFIEGQANEITLV